MTDIQLFQPEQIHNLIYTIRGKQVMLDKDLAKLYEIKPIRLREQVKRNIERFPDDFMFRLDENEVDFMVSQNAIPSKQYLGGHLPYVFTEQGVANLASVITSKKAIEINIIIMRAFVTMRKFIGTNAQFFQRLDRVELKQIEYDKKFDIVFDAQLYTKSMSKQLSLDIKRFNEQYEPIKVEKTENIHDRFIIIDRKEMYHSGASLKDLGKKISAFSKFDKEGLELLRKL